MKRKGYKEERKKENEKERENEGLIHGIIAQTHCNCTRSKNCGEKKLWESLKMMLILSLVPAVYCHYLKITQASAVVKCVS